MITETQRHALWLLKEAIAACDAADIKIAGCCALPDVHFTPSVRCIDEILEREPVSEGDDL